MDCGAAAPSVTLSIEGAVTAARLGGTGAGREGVREGLKAMSQRVATHAEAEVFTRQVRRRLYHQ